MGVFRLHRTTSTEDSAVILPQFITLRDTGYYYMTLYPGVSNTLDSLRFNAVEPDANCTFEVIPYNTDGQVYLKGANGKFVNQLGYSNNAYFRCSGDTGGAPFEIIHVKCNQIHLLSYTTSPVFMTSREASNKDGVAGSTSAGAETLFTVSEPIDAFRPHHTTSTGIQKSTAIILPQFITLRDTGRFYMTLYPGVSNILDSLRSIRVEPDANCTFEVVPYRADGVFTLKGANGKIVNQYERSNDAYFRCSGDGGGMPFEIILSEGNQIHLRSVSVGSGSVFVTSRQASNKDGVAGSTFAGADTLFTVSEPIISKEILDVHYDLPNAVVWDVPATIALQTTVRNDSDSDHSQQILAYTYQHSEVGTWNNTAGVELGVETTIKAKVPFVASGGIKVSLKASYSHQWGGSESKQKTITSSTQITIPPGKKGEVTVLVKNKAMDIKFRYKQKIVYQDGTTMITDKDGVYHNLESYDVDVQVGDWEDARGD
jgi:hypothetical protein